jgi:hypothetical protein
LEAAAAVEKACRDFIRDDGGSGKGLPRLFSRRRHIKDASHAIFTATVTAAAVDIRSGARKCTVANNTCWIRPYAIREKAHEEEIAAALTAANASMEGSRLYAVRELEAVLQFLSPLSQRGEGISLLISLRLRRNWAAREHTCSVLRVQEFSVPFRRNAQRKSSPYGIILRYLAVSEIMIMACRWATILRARRNSKLYGLNNMIFWTNHVLACFSSFMVMVTEDHWRRS